MQKGFSSGEYSREIFGSIEIDLDNYIDSLIGNIADEMIYHASHVSEIGYFVEILGIPFETLYSMDKQMRADCCGMLKSLCHGALRAKGIHKAFDFFYKKEVCNLLPEEVISLAALAYAGNMFEEFHRGKGKAIMAHILFNFLRTHTDISYVPRLDEADMHTLNKYVAVRRKKQERERQQQEKKKYRLGRNYHTVVSLAKTSLIEIAGESFHVNTLKQPGTPIPNISLLKSYAQRISQLGEKYKGLSSIGGKIHFSDAIPEEKIEKFRTDYKFDQSPFTLLHANTSLLLPPSYFPEELMLMIAHMSEYGLFAGDPQLQISIPGRLPNHLGGILGSAMLLLSGQHVEYTKETFTRDYFATKDHDNMTGRRMVAYDAGKYDNSFIRNGDTIDGRTDVLLLKDINLLPKAKIIGSLLSQSQYDGYFATLGDGFISDYIALLSRHKLAWVVDAPWIYGPDNQGDENLDNHLRVIKALTDRQHQDRMIHNTTGMKKGLLVFELMNLLTTYREKIQSVQKGFTF